ncbi:hypothetical protein [Dyella sp. 2RAB6]|uniref:hypothetical protein n=1 Tax=Dyella sp. 2RAB6 TaxID=3232992 RepID=UPI003F9001A0
MDLHPDDWGEFLPTPKPETNRVDIQWIGAADKVACCPAKWPYEQPQCMAVPPWRAWLLRAAAPYFEFLELFNSH